MVHIPLDECYHRVMFKIAKIARILLAHCSVCVGWFPTVLEHGIAQEGDYRCAAIFGVFIFGILRHLFWMD